MKSKPLFLIALFLPALIVGGCAVQNDRTEVKGLGLSYHSSVKQLQDGNYYVEAESAPAAGRISGASSGVHKDASNYCQTMNKSMKVVKEETGSHLLVNGVARLTFSCE